MTIYVHLNAKAAPIPVQRIWNAFGDHFTATRRPTAKGMLAKVVHSRMSMHLLANDCLPADMKPGGGLSISLFQDAEADIGFRSNMYTMLPKRYRLSATAWREPMTSSWWTR